MDLNGISVHLPDDIGPRFGESLSLSLSLCIWYTYIYIHIYIHIIIYIIIYIYTHTYTQHTMYFFSNWEVTHMISVDFWVFQGPLERSVIARPRGRAR